MLFHLIDKQFDIFKSSNPYPNLIKLKPILLQKTTFTFIHSEGEELLSEAGAQAGIHRIFLIIQTDNALSD